MSGLARAQLPVVEFPRPPGRGKLIDLAGQRFGRWTVLAIHPQRTRYGRKVVALWCCVCDCGNERLVIGHNLRNGHSGSCGCRIPKHGHSGSCGCRGPKHGLAKRGRRTRVYECWVGMRQRCRNPNNANYPDYGGRGIGVCERWNSFANFLADMGEPPRGKSLDRIDVNGNYEPGNCRWASIFQQARNKRRHAR
jgi:hypothetical protein